MRSFKKVILSSSAFLLIVCLLSALFIGTYFNTETGYYQDIKYRDKLKGKIDCLVVGSSHELCGFKPEIMNRRMGCCCYNISGTAMSPVNKILMLEEEIDRNPVKTVVIGIGDEDLNYDEFSNAEGEIALIPRVRSVKKRLNIVKDCVPVSDYPYVYAVYMNEGTKALLKVVTGRYESKVDPEALGWYSKEPKDITAPDYEICSAYNSTKTEFETPGNRERLLELIEMCRSRGINVILLSIPVSEKKIWPADNYDELYSIYDSIAEKYGCTFIDLNLIKNRKDLFSDEYSFTDDSHMSYKGAEAATELFCDVMTKINSGEDVSDMFYSSYDEAKKHFNYYEKYQSLTKEQS